MNKKLYVAFWPIFIRFIIVFLIALVVIFFGFFGVFIRYDVESQSIVLVPWEGQQIVTTVIVFILAIALLIISLRGYYYVIEKDHFLCVKFGKVFQYDYKNITFIDTDKSEKGSTITFYSTRARMQYLLKDKDNILYQTLLQKCQNTMSLEEFRRAHPEEKY